MGPAVNLLRDLQNADAPFPVGAAANNNSTPTLAAAANDNINSAVNNNATPAAANIISAINFLITDATPILSLL